MLAIPEMMRVMLDECGYGWDAAWDIVTRTVAYTNHTVMAEALEMLGPRTCSNAACPASIRLSRKSTAASAHEMHDTGVDGHKVGRMAPLNDGYVKMANLAVVGSHSVNGVSTPAQRNPQGRRVPRLLHG